MQNSLMAGFCRFMIQVPPSLWKKQVERAKRQAQKRMGFMSGDHRRVHHFVVQELPLTGQPLQPGRIAAALGLSMERAIELLDDLEKHMTFLFRDGEGAVIWAYPVTVEKTPHRVTFDSGEEIYAA